MSSKQLDHYGLPRIHMNNEIMIIVFESALAIEKCDSNMHKKIAEIKLKCQFVRSVIIKYMYINIMKTKKDYKN